MVHLELPDEKMGFSDGKGEMFTVSSGGEILWSRQASFRIACKMNLEKLPFDTQSCGLLAGLYSQRAEQVQLGATLPNMKPWPTGKERAWLAGWRLASSKVMSSRHSPPATSRTREPRLTSPVSDRQIRTWNPLPSAICRCIR